MRIALTKAQFEILLVVAWCAIPSVVAIVIFLLNRKQGLIRAVFLSLLVFGLVFLPLSCCLMQGSLAGAFMLGLYRVEGRSVH